MVWDNALFSQRSHLSCQARQTPQSFIIFNYCSHQSNRKETFICSVMAVGSFEILLKYIYYIEPNVCHGVYLELDVWFVVIISLMQ